MGDRHAALVAAADRERRARHRARRRPSARAAPRTNVVLPAPSSPATSTTSPGGSRAASGAGGLGLGRRARLVDRHRRRCGAAGRGRRAGARRPRGASTRASTPVCGSCPPGGRRGGARGGRRERGAPGRGVACAGERLGLLRRAAPTSSAVGLRLGLRLPAERVLVLLVARALAGRAAAGTAAREATASSATIRRQRDGTRQILGSAGHRSPRSLPCRLAHAAPHPAAHRPRLDAPPGRRHRHEPLRPGLALGRLGPPGHRHRRRYPGAAQVERLAERLTIHRMGARLTVFPRAALARPARRRPRRRRRAGGRQRHRLLHAAVVVAARAARDARPPRPPGPLRRRDRPPRPARRRSCSSACRCARSTAGTRSSRSRTPRARPGRARAPARPHPRRLPRASSPTRSTPRRAREAPTLLYLGRLKQYKRLEVAARRARGHPRRALEVAGEGDHRPVLEDEIDRRGLHDRVTLHGHVDEEEKRDSTPARGST